MRGSLSVPVIVDAALRVLEQAGLSGVTARAVAAELGVRPSALYHHLPDMTTLLDEMATALRREMGPVRAETDWAEMLRAQGNEVRRVLLAHRDGGRLFAGRRLRDIELVTAMEVPLRVLTDAGVPLSLAVLAGQAVLDLTVGFVIEEQHRASGESGEYRADARRALVDEACHPMTAAASEPMLAPPDERYAAALELLIDGVGVRLTHPDGATPKA